MDHSVGLILIAMQDTFHVIRAQYESAPRPSTLMPWEDRSEARFVYRTQDVHSLRGFARQQSQAAEVPRRTREQLKKHVTKKRGTVIAEVKSVVWSSPETRQRIEG